MTIMHQELKIFEKYLEVYSKKTIISGYLTTRSNSTISKFCDESWSNIGTSYGLGFVIVANCSKIIVVAFLVRH